ncbi:MAG TPA: L,D-transpeptidase family protein [Chthoniobacterales bacterium]
MNRKALRLLLGAVVVCLGLQSAVAQAPRATPGRPAPSRTNDPRPIKQPTPQPQGIQPMRKPAELISRQAPITINRSVYESLSPNESRVVVNLTKQRAFLLAGDQIAIDSPISSGKRAGMTPTGSFHVMEKDKDHRSSIYGDFKDRAGRTVRGGVSVRIDSAPSGTHFVGAPMLWFMRLTGDGVGMHVGILPGYPASHGCIRMPPQAAEMFYNRVKTGTPVEVVRD